MKNTILKEGLKNVPLVNPVLISISGGKLYVSSYTETTAVLYSVPTDGEDLSVILLPEAVKNLTKMVSSKEADMELRVMDDNLYVSVGKKKAIFTTSVEKDTLKAARMLRDNTLSPTFTCDISELSKALSDSSHYSGDRTIADVRFHGYHLLASGSTGEIMSSNNKGMAVRNFPVREVKEDINIVVPKDLLFLTKGLIGDASVELRESRLFIDVESGETKYRILCALVNSTPLPYRGILPKEADKTNTFRVSKNDMNEAISEASYFSPDDVYRRVRLTVKEGTLTLNATNSNNGRMEASIPVSAENEDEFEMSYVTLSQAVGNSPNDILTFEVYPKRIVLESGPRNILAKFDV